MITGAIAADEKLPSVRELAGTLAINPNTIQRAYRELEAEGYLYSVSGKGTFAAKDIRLDAMGMEELFLQFEEIAEELLIDSCQMADECRFSCSIRSYQSVDRTFFYMEIGSIQCPESIKGFYQIFYLYHCSFLLFSNLSILLFNSSAVTEK